MTSHRLDFLNPQWHRGMNVTIRKGSKWYLKAEVDDLVNLYQTGKVECVATGCIQSLRYIPFAEVSLRDLWEEHDRECGTAFGLTHAMLRAYPDFTLDDMVTVIRFEIL